MLTMIPFHYQAQICLKLLKSRKCFDLKILKSLSMELTIQKQNILYHLGEEWQKLIVWKFPPSKGAADLRWTALLNLPEPVWPLNIFQIFYVAREEGFIY